MLSKSNERYKVGGRAAVINLNELIGVEPGHFYIVAGAGSKASAAEAALRVHESQGIHKKRLATPSCYSSVEIHPTVYIVCVVEPDSPGESSGHPDYPEPPGDEERWDGEVSGEVFKQRPEGPL